MKKIFRAIVFVILSLPKTIYFNFKTLPFLDAIYMPILLGYNTKILNCKSNIINFNSSFVRKPFTIRIGFGGTEVVPIRKGIININEGKLFFGNEDCFAAGIVLDVNGGELRFGDSFSANRNCFISCSKKIDFGHSVMLGWNVDIRDSDGHLIAQNHIIKEHQKPVVIGNHVWLCSESTILKGSKIEEGSVVGYKALVTKPFNEAHVLIAGSPASIVQDRIDWAHIGQEERLL